MKNKFDSEEKKWNELLNFNTEIPNDFWSKLDKMATPKIPLNIKIVKNVQYFYYTYLKPIILYLYIAITILTIYKIITSPFLIKNFIHLFKMVNKSVNWVISKLWIIKTFSRMFENNMLKFMGEIAIISVLSTFFIVIIGITIYLIDNNILTNNNKKGAQI